MSLDIPFSAQVEENKLSEGEKGMGNDMKR